MNDTDSDEEYYVESDFARENTVRLHQLMRDFTSFVLHGEQGIGKTMFLHRLLDSYRGRNGVCMPYIVVNCLRAERKPAVYSVLQREISRAAELEQSLPTMNSLESLSNQLNYCYQKRTRKEFNKIDEAGGLYCLLECVEQTKTPERFLDSLIEIGRECLPFKMAFILCRTVMPTMNHNHQSQSYNMLKFCFDNPKPRQINEIMMHELKKREKEFARHYSNFAAFSTALCKQLTESVLVITTRISQVKDYVGLAFDKLMDLNKLELESKQAQNAKNGVKQPDKIPFDVHRVMISVAFKEFMWTNLEYGPAPESEFEKKKDRTNADLGNIDLNDWEDEEKQQFYVDLLKTSVDMAARCDERDDIKRFTDSKQTGKGRHGSKTKMQPTDIQVKNKKINMFRVLAIADSLESAIVREDDTYKQESTEFHSLDYKMCIQHLVKREKLKVGSGGGAFGLGKLSSRVTKYEDLAFLKRNKLKRNEFFEG